MEFLMTTFDSMGLIEDKVIDAYITQLGSEMARFKKGTYAFSHACNDVRMQEQILSLVQEKSALHPSMLIVVGIGGSNLGTLAVQQAIYGLFYNEKNLGLQIYYADTVDTDCLRSILAMVHDQLTKGRYILINVVSKSGKTTETVVNFDLFLSVVKQYQIDTYRDSVVVTTDRDSPLWCMAKKEGWSILEIPKDVGGRYSVLTPVSLFPLAMLNIDIKDLIKGASDGIEQYIKKDRSNTAAVSAAWQYALCKKGYAVSNMFLFSNELHALGNWWRQLMGESLGKAKKLNDSQNKDPLLPIISLGTTDLHSMGQLYLANIMPIMTTFVCVKQESEYIVSGPYELVDHVRGKSVADIMSIILKGVQRAYKNQYLPYRTIVFPQKNAYYMGQFLQQSMFEVVYIAYLLGVNPFDQPAVELYKQETKELLSYE